MIHLKQILTLTMLIAHTAVHDSSSGNDDESISTIELPIPAIILTGTVERFIDFDDSLHFFVS